jgi:signal transduction histidine kinase
VRKAVLAHESFNLEYVINPIGGGKPKWLKATGKSYYDADGKPTIISGTVIDITENKFHDQQKDDFISIASHELKTPVTSLKAALQLMDKIKDNVPPSPMMGKLIEQSNRSMDKVSTLIEDLLNLSRMNEGQLSLNKTHFNLGAALAASCSHVRIGGKHNLILEQEADIEVYADEHRIDQVVTNIVNNAVKYAPNSRDIVFSLKIDNGMALVSISDNGPGISADKQEHLFERYYRTDAAGYQNSGLGLGLYISAEIVRKHGGQIGVESEPGKGSRFWFTLPL